MSYFCVMIKHQSQFPVYILVLISLISCDIKSGRNLKSAKSNALIDYYVHVVKISDGDTFIGLTTDNKRIRFRMQGIDAPEKTQAFSKRSTEKLSELIFDKAVGIDVHTSSDRYGRPVVYVYTLEGMDVGAEMLKSGMAWHYKYYDNSKFYSDLEHTARKKKTGLWKDKNPVPPWEFRKIKRKK